MPPLPSASTEDGVAEGLFSFEDGLPREEGEDVRMGHLTEAGPTAMDHTAMGSAAANPAAADPAADRHSEQVSTAADDAWFPNELDGPGRRPRSLTVDIDEDTSPASSSVSPRHEVEGWLKQMVASNASDLILRSGGDPLND